MMKMDWSGAIHKLRYANLDVIDPLLPLLPWFNIKRTPSFLPNMNKQSLSYYTLFQYCGDLNRELVVLIK